VKVLKQLYAQRVGPYFPGLSSKYCDLNDCRCNQRWATTSLQAPCPKRP
jgi:hypothetical protein